MSFTLNFATRIVAIAGLLTVCTLTPARGQLAGANLSGVVRDSTGALVSGATVSMLNAATGTDREVTTNADGLYSAPNLLPGTYEIKVSAPQFATMIHRGLELNVGAELSLDFALRVGQTSEIVQVTDVALGVETTTSAVGHTVDQRTVVELPLNGRDWTQLATLEPGVVSAPTQVSTAITANKGNRGFGNQLSDSGHRPYENTYRVNGINVNDYSNGSPGGAIGINLGVDAVREFSVLTTDYPADYGRTSGAVINAITRSGANEPHGTAYFFDRDKIFDARNYFDPTTIPSFRRIQFGASGGAAIVKDKAFFYADYEGVRQNQPVTSLVTVPSNEALAGTLCKAPGCATTTTVPVDPNAQKYFPLFTHDEPASLANVTGTDTVSFSTASPIITSENYFTGRYDQNLSASDNIAASYFWDSGPQSQADALNNVVHDVFSRRQMGSVEETHIFSSQLVNTFSAGLSRVRGDINLPASAPNNLAASSSLAIAPGAAATPNIAISGLTPILGLGGNNQFFHHWTSVQVNDDAFWTHGTHSIRLGFAFERMDYNVLEKLSPNGRMSYKDIASFVQNTPVTLKGAHAPGGSNEVALRSSLVAGYIQDDWRTRPGLTLNLGLRYEMSTVPKDANNRIQAITTLVGCTASPTACGPVHLGSFTSSNPTLKNFEPRVGFAWDPFNNAKTALRGAIGLFDVLPLPYVFALNSAATYPYQIVASGPGSQLGVPASVTFNPNKIRQRYIQQNPKRAMVSNWNLNIEHQFARNLTAMVGYVGSRSVHLSYAADDINLVLPTQSSAGLLWPAVPGSQPAPDPNWAGGFGGAGIRPTMFDGASSYNGLQSQLKKTLSHGMQGQISYSFGKCRDLGSASLTGDTFTNSIAVPIPFSKSYRLGACDFDIRHNLVGTIIWDLPSFKDSSALVSSVAGGWELGTIVHYSSGAPFTAVVGGGGDPLGTGFNGDFSMDFASILPGCNPILGGLNYLNAKCFTLPYAPAAFATANCTPNDPVNQTGFYAATIAPPAGMAFCSNLLGNAGRNSLYGPSLVDVDLSLFKNFPVSRISEAFRIQFRAEFFNVINHTNFGAPGFLNPSQNNSIFDSTGALTVGSLNTTSTTSRQIQLGLKMIW